jgi:hypothetical protein
MLQHNAVGSLIVTIILQSGKCLVPDHGVNCFYMLQCIAEILTPAVRSDKDLCIYLGSKS